MLNLSPSTGYDIKKYCDQVLSGFWNENFGHIYPTLKKLLEDGMIEVASKSDNTRKVCYEITEKGKKELDVWLVEDTTPQPVRSEFMLKLLFSSSQPKEQVVKMLMDYKMLHEKKVSSYKQMQSALQEGIEGVTKEREFFLNAVLRRGIISDEAVVC